VHGSIDLHPLSADFQCSSHSLRIFAGWYDIGGKLPVIGEIHATYQDIIKTVTDADRDIRDYFTVQNRNVVSAACTVPAE